MDLNQITLRRRKSSRWMFLLLATTVFLGVAIFLVLVLQVNPETESCVIIGFVVFWLVPIGLILLFAFRTIRIDQNGLSQRFFIFSHLWKWSEFASGKVIKLDAHRLKNCGRRFLFRTLQITFLSDVDKQILYEAINLRSSHPKMDSSVLNVRFNFGNARYRIDSHGIHENDNDGDGLTRSWNDLASVHIHKSDPVRLDYRTIILKFRTKQVVIESTDRKNKVSLDDQAAITTLLKKHVRDCLIHETYTGELITDDVLVQQEMSKNIERFRKLLSISGLFAAIVVLKARTEPQPLAWIICHAVVFSPIIVWGLYKQHVRNSNLKKRTAVAT